MPLDPELSSLPFLTRKMLAFEGQVTFSLVVRSLSATNDIIAIRGMTKEGPFILKHTVNGSGVVGTQTFQLPDVPIYLSVNDPDQLFGRGELFVSVALAINGDEIYRLLSGYVYFQHALAWPNTFTEDAVPTKGKLLVKTGADPAAGVEQSITVPTGEIWEVLSVRFTLVAAAAAANRIVHLIFQQGGFSMIECISSVTQIISETKVYTCIPTATNGALSDDNDIIIPIPSGILLQAGQKIITETTGLNAGDNYGTMQVAIKDFIFDA